jgi:hypothetical protein
VKWIGGTQVLVSATAPGGTRYSIIAQHYRFSGGEHLEISTRFAEPWHVAQGGTDSSWGGSRLLAEPIKVTTACDVHPFAIWRGRLRNSGDVVLARMGTRVVPLSERTLSSSQHVAGVLVYGVTPRLPDGVVIRTRGGKLVSLTRVAAGKSIPEGCYGQEREWVSAHFAAATAPAALARIIGCMRRLGFEVGAPDAPPLGIARRSAYRRMLAAQRLCRAGVKRALARA